VQSVPITTEVVSSKYAHGELYFRYNQDENKFNNIYKLYRNEEEMEELGQHLVIYIGIT
jgi:hypothetical protein